MTLDEAIAYLTPHRLTNGPVILDPKKMREAIAEISALRAAQVGGERVRHLKRGTEYDVLHRGVELQISYAPVMEGSKLAIYRGADGKVWAREEMEFDDGRFAQAGANDAAHA